MKNTEWMRLLVWLVRFLLAAVFIGAALPKIAHPHEFALAISRYQIVPYWIVNIMAMTLPWIELVAGVALVLPGRRAPSAFVIASLMAVFTVAVFLAVIRGIDITCGCFSVNPDAQRVGWKKVAENTGLFAAAGWLLIQEARMMQLNRKVSR